MKVKEYSHKRPPVWAVGSLIKTLPENRYLIWRLFFRDFSAKYRQSVLGVFWAIFQPLLYISIFFYLNQKGVFKTDTKDVPYVLFGFIGITVWQLFVSCLTQVTNSLVSSGAMVTRIRVRLDTLVFASSGNAVVELIIRLFMLCGFLVYFEQPILFESWLFILALLPAFLLALGIGFITSLANAILRDTAQLVSSVLPMLLFVTPVFFSPETTHSMSLTFLLNPMAGIIVGARDLLLFGEMSNLPAYVFATVVSLLVFIVGWAVFNASSERAIERI